MLHDITKVLFVMQKHVSEALCRFSNLLLKYIHITGFILLFWDRFKDFFQDFSRIQIYFIQGSKFHLKHFFPKNSKSIFLTVHLHFSYRKNSENFISRVLSRFPGLESPGKLQNKIPGLSRFSRTPPYQVHFINLPFWRMLVKCWPNNCFSIQGIRGFLEK